MFQLKNKLLSIDIVDPLNDRELLGSRYCTGGYIYQIKDNQGRDLLYGPSYPAMPDTFDGQGAPETFVRALESNSDTAGGTLSMIGVGDVIRSVDDHPFDPRFNREVVQWLDWTVTQTDNSISMSAEHQFKNWAYRITCEVTLKECEIISKTSITSLGQDILPIQWFPHPFFPIPTSPELFKTSVQINPEVTHPYSMGKDGYINRHKDFNWIEGAYLALDFDKQSAMGTQNHQNHDLCSDILVNTDYQASFFPIWGNDKCFSFEPYFETELQTNQSAQWQVSYSFQQ